MGEQQVEIWDADTLKTQRALHGHAGVVHSLAYSPDGRTLASASWDYTVRLWDPATGKSLSVVKGHTQKVNTVAFSPDGRLLATCSNDRAVKLWRLPVDPEVIDLPVKPGRLSYLPGSRPLLMSFDKGIINSEPWVEYARRTYDGQVVDTIGNRGTTTTQSAHMGRRKVNIESMLAFERHLNAVWRAKGVDWKTDLP